MSIRSNKCLKKYCSLIYNYKNTCTPTKISDKRTTCIGLYIQVKLIMKELKRVNYLCHLISNLNHTCNVNIFTSKQNQILPHRRCPITVFQTSIQRQRSLLTQNLVGRNNSMSLNVYRCIENQFEVEINNIINKIMLCLGKN